ncbi:Uncharacterized protein TCM_031793 [Theobroma cacao]|uniref:Reverse transcriptase domain-containing protein n=1 Tax=Theobroma cacao TaxID=3641 RepID=A0A061FFN1_THECC|nr:Uncharacterized protein TCM_031793 [Theobroma cacao]
MEKAEAFDILQGVPIGNNDLLISHLQFADDTMVFCRPKVENLSIAKRVLRCFQLISGLKINFNKSRVIGIGVDNQTWRRGVENIDCRIGEIPFVYLELPIGAKQNSVRMWNPIIEKFEARLARWKAKVLIIGGRVTLLRSVLTSLLIFGG